MTVGENIRAMRKEHGLTQKELGKLSGINEVQIRQYELGKANPKIETLEKIANALSISVMSLLSGCFDMYKISYHDTKEYKDLQRETLAFHATLKLLENIYKRAEDIEVGAYKDGSLVYSSNYISIGEGQKKIAISNSSFDKIVETLKANLSSYVELIGENEIDFLKNWENESNIDTLSLSISERTKIVLEDENGEIIPYIRPF